MITPAITRRTVIVAASVAVLACFLWCGEPPPPPPRPLVLELFVTPDAWEPGEDRVLTDPIEIFNRERATVEGRVIRVEPVDFDSGTVEDLLLKRPSQAPDVWIPASRVWSQLLAFAHPDLVAYEAPTLIKSPQVLAVWEEAADDLGPRLGWSDVLTFVQNPREWSRRTGAVGPFRLAHTDPERSTSGLSAAVSEFYLAARKTRDLDINDVFRGVGTVQEIQKAILHYGPTSGDILEQFACYGTSYASAVYIQETSLRRFNEGGYEPPDPKACPGVDPKPAAELHGYYPADGTFIAEYPCITMDPLEKGIQQAAANIFCDWLEGQLRRTAEAICDNYHYVVPGRACGRPLPPNTLPVPSNEVLNEIQELWPKYRRAGDVDLGDRHIPFDGTVARADPAGDFHMPRRSRREGPSRPRPLRGRGAARRSTRGLRVGSAQRRRGNHQYRSAERADPPAGWSRAFAHAAPERSEREADRRDGHPHRRSYGGP